MGRHTTAPGLETFDGLKPHLHAQVLIGVRVY
jgi:hypothetical protein